MTSCPFLLAQSHVRQSAAVEPLRVAAATRALVRVTASKQTHTMELCTADIKDKLTID